MLNSRRAHEVPGELREAYADLPEIVGLIWNGEPDGAFYARGHVAPEAFAAAVGRMIGACPCLDDSLVLHRWARLIPRECEEFNMEFRLYEESAPGAFPVTFMEHEG